MMATDEMAKPTTGVANYRIYSPAPKSSAAWETSKKVEESVVLVSSRGNAASYSMRLVTKERPMKIIPLALLILSLLVSCSYQTERFDDNYIKNCRAIGAKDCR